MNNVCKARLAPGVRTACAVACGLVLSGVMASGVAMADDQLDPLVVTATGVPTRVSRLTADTTVISREQLSQATGQSLTDVLASVAGLQIVSNGGLGKSSSVSIRGGDAKHTVLLIDGVRYGSATLGTPVFDTLPLDLIDHVEVVRGPLASLYGADAASGVIQVFTRRGSEGWHPFASVTLGSDRYHDETLGFTGGQGDWTYALQASDQATSGYSATNARVGDNYNPDRDGYRQQSFTGSVDWRLARDWTLSGNLMRVSGKSWWDDGVATSGTTPSTASQSDSSVTGLALKGRVLPAWRTQVRLSETIDASETTVAQQSYNVGRFETRQSQLTWENYVDVGLGQVLVAAEHTHQGVSGSTQAYAVTARDIDSLLVGWSGHEGAHDWQLNARRDHNSQYGTEDTGNAGYGYHLNDAWRVGASAGTSYVAPSFNQLYWKSSYWNGDPTLKPQHGLSRELNVAWTGEGASAKVVRYDNRVHDFIQTSSTNASNVDGVRMAGWTLSGRIEQQLDALRVYASGSLDWTDAHKVADDTRLKRVAARTGQLRVGAAHGRVDASISVRGSSGASDDNANYVTDHLPGYTVWGANVSYKLNPEWKLALRAENVGNHAYETAWGYNMPRTQVFVTLAYAAAH